MENTVFLPIALLLLFIISKIMKRAVFYDPVGRAWKKNGKWYHYALYIILMLFFSIVCLTPFFPGTAKQIGRYIALSRGQVFVEYEDRRDEVYDGLPDTEFVMMYEVKSSAGPQEMLEEIIPAILKYHRTLSECGMIRVFGDYDFSREYTIQYDSTDKKYLLYLENEVAADITVKRKLFFKVIYFHGYQGVYQNQKTLDTSYSSR